MSTETPEETQNREAAEAGSNAGTDATSGLKPLIEAKQAALVRTSEGLSPLSPELMFFLNTILFRFDQNVHAIRCHTPENRIKLEKRLKANPEKIEALKKMEESGGAPEVTGLEGDEFIFDEVALSLPETRAWKTYAQAEQAASAMGGGAKLIRPERYELLWNEMRIPMDRDGARTWLDSSHRNEKRYGRFTKPNTVLTGRQRDTGTEVEVAILKEPGDQSSNFIFRCTIKV